jgi:hypothetical protein
MRPRCRREDSIKTYLKEVRCEYVDWIHLAQHANQSQSCEHGSVS